MPLRDVLLALLAVTLLGLNFVAIKVALQELPPLLLTASRFMLAAVPAIFVIARPAVPLRLIVSFGLAFGAVQFALLFMAIAIGMPAGLSSLVMQMQVFFTIGLAAVVFRERPTTLQIGGAVLGACGMAVIAGGLAAHAPLFPMMLVLLAALSWAVANILVKGAGKVDMLALVVWGSLVATPPLLAASLLFEGADRVGAALAGMGWRSVAALLFIAYPTTILALTLWNSLLARYPAATVTPFALLVPIAGIVSTHFAFAEPFGVPEALGSLLVISGLGLNVWSARRAGSRRISA